MDDPPPPGPNPEDFDRLLAWLDPDREKAGARYNQICARLARRFEQLARRFGRLGCPDPLLLTGRTIDRVVEKLPKLIQTYKGDPEPYFYAVAYKVFQEYLREPTPEPLPDSDLPGEDARTLPEPSEDEDEAMHACLDRCLEQLGSDEREMILDYYRGGRGEKIRLRKEQARRLGITLANLRLRARRVRVKLKQCVTDCLRERPRA